MKAILTSFFLIVFFFSSCKKQETVVITPNDLHKAVEKVTEIMVHDIFSPPVASRIFAYPNIAAYEIIALNNPEYKTLQNQLKDFSAIPAPKDAENLNYQMAALIAHIDLSRRLIFSEEKMEALRDSLYGVWNGKNEAVFNKSKTYGLEVANHVANWMDKDNYKQTRTMPKFTVNSDDNSRWQPTPPSYMDGIEPHWAKIRPFLLETPDQFKPAPPPPFSLEENSDFYKEVKGVYAISLAITEKGDSSEEIKIAQFWDCNPYVSVTRGHLMFATKKITPGAHWIGITKIASKKSNFNFDDTVYAYTKTSMAIADAFISCWDEKYRSNLIRPETVINQYIDENWKPILQTPPFPEYTSGHSVVSGAAATILTSIFGDNFSFDDETEVPYGLPVRSFTSFNQAADEAAVSRLYGGIHYRATIEVGITQGRNIGAFVVDKLKMKTTNTLVAQ